MTADRSDPERRRPLPAAALKRLERAGLLDGSGELGWRLTAAGESAAIDFLTSRTAPWADAEPDDQTH